MITQELEFYLRCGRNQFKLSLLQTREFQADPDEYSERLDGPTTMAGLGRKGWSTAQLQRQTTAAIYPDRQEIPASTRSV